MVLFQKYQILFTFFIPTYIFQACFHFLKYSNVLIIYCITTCMKTQKFETTHVYQFPFSMGQNPCPTQLSPLLQGVSQGCTPGISKGYRYILRVDSWLFTELSSLQAVGLQVSVSHWKQAGGHRQLLFNITVQFIKASKSKRYKTECSSKTEVTVIDNHGKNIPSLLMSSVSLSKSSHLAFPFKGRKLYKKGNTIIEHHFRNLTQLNTYFRDST